MYGKIKVLELDGNDMPQTPVGLEYGVSSARYTPPLSQQLTNEFWPLMDGTYYIWWRSSGGEWNESQVMKEVVLCQNISNSQALIQAYFDDFIGDDFPEASTSIEDLDTHNFKANDTSVSITSAIHSTEDYSFLDLDKVVAVYVDGVFSPWKNDVPAGGDSSTEIYNDAGIIKWHAANAGYELSSNQNISIVVVV